MLANNAGILFLLASEVKRMQVFVHAITDGSLF